MAHQTTKMRNIIRELDTSPTLKTRIMHMKATTHTRDFSITPKFLRCGQFKHPPLLCVLVSDSLIAVTCYGAPRCTIYTSNLLPSARKKATSFYFFSIENSSTPPPFLSFEFFFSRGKMNVITKWIFVPWTIALAIHRERVPLSYKHNNPREGRKRIELSGNLSCRRICWRIFFSFLCPSSTKNNLNNNSNNARYSKDLDVDGCCCFFYVVYATVEYAKS